MDEKLLNVVISVTNTKVEVKTWIYSINYFSVGHRGDQGQVSCAEELDGWSMHSQDYSMGKVDVQLYNCTNTNDHKRVSFSNL